MGVNFLYEFAFMDVGDICINIQLVSDTQTTTNNTLIDFDEANNTTTTKLPNEVVKAMELALSDVLALIESKFFCSFTIRTTWF